MLVIFQLFSYENYKTSVKACFGLQSILAHTVSCAVASTLGKVYSGFWEMLPNYNIPH